MGTPSLPPGVRFIQRDWLSANHILLLHDNQSILVDSGFFAAIEETLRRLRDPVNLGSRPLDRIINTHCHCDHMGGNAALSRVYDCEITVPKGEASAVRHWDRMALWLDFADHRAERFWMDSAIAPGAEFCGGGLTWKAIAAPGHDMGALVFYCEEARLLISGDALWEHSFGLVLPDPLEGIAAARATLETLAALDIECVLPGHGKIFRNVGEVLNRAFARADYLAQSPERLARHSIKAMFSFTLLDRERLPLATLPEYLRSVAGFAQLNERYLHLSAIELAEWLVSDLEKAGAARRESGVLVSTVSKEA